MQPSAGFASSGASDFVRNADLSPRFPTVSDEPSRPASGPARPMLFPGLEREPAEPAPSEGGGGAEIRTASAEPISIRGDGVEMNFEGADIPTVAKTLLGDVLQLNFVVDPRVQGTVTLASVGPIARKDVMPAFESALRMQNAAIVREGKLVKIVPLADATGHASLSAARQQGFGVSVVPLRYVSASTIAKTAENFLSKAGAIRVDQARNLLLVQGTSAEREAAVDVISTFDVEWMRNQSIGVYPLKSTSPETMIGELERVFETSEGGAGQGVIQFQPIARMNAVMVVAKNPSYLKQTTQWVQRLDRSDSSGTTLRTYRLRHGNATQVAKILNDIFVNRSGTTADTPGSQLAPGTTAAQSRLDSLGGSKTTSASRGSSSSSAAAQTTGGDSPFNAAFKSFGDGKGANADTTAATPAVAAAGTGPARGTFQNLRITADTVNNSIVVYSNQEDYRVVERALRDIDKPRLQVAIEATIAEVTLTDDLAYGVQYFLTSKDVGAGVNKGSVGLIGAASSAAQTVALQRVLPGFNLLLGSEQTPRVILNALSRYTDVKVLSSPSIVALDNQPALLQVGDEVPITTSSATVLSNSNLPVVNTIEMRNTGVILKVLPHVSSNGTIQLEVDQEISNVVNPDQQTLTPTIAQRRVHSTVAVTSGQMVLLGGLISERDQRIRSGIPGLRDVKFLGDVFGSTNGTKLRSEIIIFIRPQLVRNGVDARAVTEEFREKLQTMRGVP
jgi:general secretion pathway protein D